MIYETTSALDPRPSASLSAHSFPAADYTLKVTPQTIAWGYYWSAAKPVLTVQSGDTVEIQTVSGNPERLEQAGVPADQIPPALRTIYKEIPQDQRGPGGHLLTGPVAIEGAEPGDVLEVRIREIRMDVPFAYNTFRKGSGFLPDEFEGTKMKIIPLDRERKIGTFASGHRASAQAVLRQHGHRSAAGRRQSEQRSARAFTPATWITRNWWPEPLSSFRCMRTARCSKSATATPAWATAKWTSPPWRLRSPACSSSSCIRTCISHGRARRRPRTGSPWDWIRI